MIPDRVARLPSQAVDRDERSIYASAGLGGRVIRGTSPAVVVVDMQKGFTDTGNPLGTSDEATLNQILRLLRTSRAKRLPLYFSVIAYPQSDVFNPWFEKMPHLATLREGSVWTELDERLRRQEHEPLIVKQQPSAAFDTDLVDQLRVASVDTVVVVGATTSGCVRATVVDLMSYGYRVLVPYDAVSDRTHAPHRAALFDIDAKYGDVLSTDEVIEYLESTRTTA